MTSTLLKQQLQFLERARARLVAMRPNEKRDAEKFKEWYGHCRGLDMDEVELRKNIDAALIAEATAARELQISERVSEIVSDADKVEALRKAAWAACSLFVSGREGWPAGTSPEQAARESLGQAAPPEQPETPPAKGQDSFSKALLGDAP